MIAISTQDSRVHATVRTTGPFGLEGCHEAVTGCLDDVLSWKKRDRSTHASRQWNELVNHLQTRLVRFKDGIKGSGPNLVKQKPTCRLAEEITPEQVEMRLGLTIIRSMKDKRKSVVYPNFLLPRKIPCCTKKEGNLPMVHARLRQKPHAPGTSAPNHIDPHTKQEHTHRGESKLPEESKTGVSLQLWQRKHDLDTQTPCQ